MGVYPRVFIMGLYCSYNGKIHYRKNIELNLLFLVGGINYNLGFDQDDLVNIFPFGKSTTLGIDKRD